ncbi:MAG: hypothetical protein JW915_19140 [Chitinispirillaceae bacterium]|nr:hypothetical protein [Chitinispirillaceae bacterium]
MKPEKFKFGPVIDLAGLFNLLLCLTMAYCFLFCSSAICSESHPIPPATPSVIVFPVGNGTQSFLHTAAPERFPSSFDPCSNPCSLLSIRTITEYNCLYREWNNAVSNGGDNKSQSLELIIAQNPGFAIVAGGKVNLYEYKYSHSKYHASVDADLSSTDLYFGYIYNASYYKLGALLATDLRQTDQVPGLKGFSLLKHLRLTPAIDYTLFCSAAVKPLYLQTTLTNRSVIAGTIQIKNRSNNNYRFTDIDINKDSLCFKGVYDFGPMALECNLIAEVFQTCDMQYGSRLLLSIDGTSYGCITGVRIRRLQYTPSLQLGINRKELLFRAMESTGERFSQVNDIASTTINAMTSLTLSRKTGLSLFFERINCTGDDGFFEVYPFTSWGIILDIPDRYKISDLAMSLHNTGVTVHYNKTFTPKHALLMQGSLSYAIIDGHYTSQELVRYMGLLPLYQNLTIHSVKKNYITLYPELVYTHTTTHCTAFLKLRQFVPIELKKKFAGKSSNGQVNTKKSFGGFNAVLCLEFNKR